MSPMGKIMTKRAKFFSLFLAGVLQLSVTMGARAQSSPSTLYTGSDWNTIPVAVRRFFVIGYGHGFSRGIRLAASLKTINGKGAFAPQAAMERLYLRNFHPETSPIQ